MKYSVISVTDGNHVVRAEHIKDIESAKQSFYHWAEQLIADKSFEYGTIKLLDENLDCVEGKLEVINRRQPAPEPEPVEE